MYRVMYVLKIQANAESGGSLPIPLATGPVQAPFAPARLPFREEKKLIRKPNKKTSRES